MSDEAAVDVGLDAQATHFRCECGWDGVETEIDDWDVQTDRDRLVRNCPDCGQPVPEWGTFGPIDAVATVARGPLRETLREEGVVSE